METKISRAEIKLDRAGMWRADSEEDLATLARRDATLITRKEMANSPRSPTVASV